MNRKYILSLVFAFFFVMASSPFIFGGEVSEKIFVFRGNVFKNDTVKLRNISIEEGVPTNFNNKGDYKIELSSKDKIFYSKWTTISFIAYPFGKSPVNLTKVNKYWRLPYYKEAEYIKLYHNNNLLRSFHIPEYICKKDGKCLEYCMDRGDVDCKKRTTSTTSDTTSTEPKLKCGNGICEKDENQKNCPEDCGTEFPYYILWVVIAIVIVIVSAMIIFESKKTSEENYE